MKALVPPTAFMFRRRITLRHVGSGFSRSCPKCWWVLPQSNLSSWWRWEDGSRHILLPVNCSKVQWAYMAYLEDPHVMEQFTVISHKAVVSSGTHGFICDCLPSPTSPPFFLHSSCPVVVPLYKASGCKCHLRLYFQGDLNFKKINQITIQISKYLQVAMRSFHGEESDLV